MIKRNSNCKKKSLLSMFLSEILQGQKSCFSVLTDITSFAKKFAIFLLNKLIFSTSPDFFALFTK